MLMWPFSSKYSCVHLATSVWGYLPATMLAYSSVCVSLHVWGWLFTVFYWQSKLNAITVYPVDYYKDYCESVNFHGQLYLSIWSTKPEIKWKKTKNGGRGRKTTYSNSEKLVVSKEENFCSEYCHCLTRKIYIHGWEWYQLCNYNKLICNAYQHCCPGNCFTSTKSTESDASCTKPVKCSVKN